MTGIGPAGSSLLHKLGLKKAHEISLEELELIVAKNQTYRSVQRALGRIKKMETTNSEGRKRAIKKQPITLESLGFAPAIITALRSKGIADDKIIASLQQKGLL